VTDALGCEDILNVGVGVTNTTEVIPQIGTVTLAPNPTTDQTQLEVNFLQPLDARIQVLNTVGQLLYEIRDREVQTGNYTLDLSQYDSGLYFVRVIAGGQARTVKLIKAGQ
ncbi:MAG TPA: T9SS type A sorting domain-containing protein, partial [Phaeodactylibacter sp.]|nr:T9SS type A sorting domain-containing protein [Phaeodactylibacter sp.]